MTRTLSLALLAFGLVPTASADPCGMVPPIRIADSNVPAIQRTGAQRTYVMFKDGVQTMALRPGFSGKIDEFGMLIPFPSPPALRKIDDDTFAHIEGAVDPPVMNVFVYDDIPRPSATGMRFASAGSAPVKSEDSLRIDEVRVVNQEAVGMYQVAVLEAGSATALKGWMDDNGFRYPDGMDATVEDYVGIRWCFVAIKATVGQAMGVAPQPGMRTVDSALPDGAAFDGHVQGMGFRFETPEPVVPMRLSVFNPDTSGDGPRNVVYALTEQPVKVSQINSDLVRRQVQGNELHGHLTQPIELVWHNGGPEDVTPEELDGWRGLRDPAQYNGIAAQLFAADLHAVSEGELSLAFEEEEKELLRISESFGLRGAEIDTQHAAALDEMRDEVTGQALDAIKEMSLTVIDGRFPVPVLAEENLTFAQFRMDEAQNVTRTDEIRPSGPTRTIYRNR